MCPARLCQHTVWRTCAKGLHPASRIVSRHSRTWCHLSTRAAFAVGASGMTHMVARIPEPLRKPVSWSDRRRVLSSPYKPTLDGGTHASGKPPVRYWAYAEIPHHFFFFDEEWGCGLFDRVGGEKNQRLACGRCRRPTVLGCRLGQAMKQRTTQRVVSPSAGLPTDQNRVDDETHSRAVSIASTRWYRATTGSSSGGSINS